MEKLKNNPLIKIRLYHEKGSLILSIYKYSNDWITGKTTTEWYERRSTEKQKGEFQKKERGWFTRVKRWFSRKFNYGASHDVPQPGTPAADLNNTCITPNNNGGMPVNIDPAAMAPHGNIDADPDRL